MRRIPPAIAVVGAQARPDDQGCTIGNICHCCLLWFGAGPPSRSAFAAHDRLDF